MNELTRQILEGDRLARERQAALTDDQRAFLKRLEDEIQARVWTVLAANPRISFTEIAEELATERARVALRGSEELCVHTCELVDGVLRVVASRPIQRITIEGTVAAATLTPPCDPSNPCGCYGCATCNGAQAPSYGFFGGVPTGSTPAYGSPAVACTCGSATCNKCRAQRGMGPAGVTPARGSAKPGGGGSPKTRAANAERGYRVLSYSAWLNREDGSREGDSFSTPDLATQRARRDAKAGKETFIVLRDGARWKLLKQDGDEVVVG